MTLYQIFPDSRSWMSTYWLWNAVRCAIWCIVDTVYVYCIKIQCVCASHLSLGVIMACDCPNLKYFNIVLTNSLMSFWTSCENIYIDIKIMSSCASQTKNPPLIKPMMTTHYLLLCLRNYWNFNRKIRALESWRPPSNLHHMVIVAFLIKFGFQLWPLRFLIWFPNRFSGHFTNWLTR